ncbi:uncharacterized protein LOC105844098 isoform X2 [Hydra vulgaris]|uniref:Uncharacterized protein LOC105844098 isoform X2 n=1 Tax=Hydra vulgaris TaxID=6087 RepID=A0ABM4DFY1_HYDVU
MDPKLKTILSENLSSEWKEFAMHTGINVAVVNYHDLDKVSEKVKMENLCNDLVKKHENNYMAMIEKSLRELDQMDVLNEIQTFCSIEKLKLHYIETYDADPQQTRTNNTVKLYKNHFDLVNGDCFKNNDENAEKINFNEWRDFIKKQSNYKTVTFEDIFEQDSNDSLVLISGIAGIGKTYFLKKCLLLWAKELIWKNTDFVFYFDLTNSIDFQSILSLNELIMKLYSGVLVAQKITFKWSIKLLIDGLDKFTHFEKLLNHKLGLFSNIPLVNMLEHILSAKEIKCILAGRVQAVSKYMSAGKEDGNILNIQIMGFNNLGMKFYLQDNLLSKTLQKNLNYISSSSIEGKSLLSVPLYLKAICSTTLHLLVHSVKTLTELHTLILYYFMQQKSKSKSITLYELMLVNNQYFLGVCKIASILLQNQRVSILPDEFLPILEKHDLEPIGFIEMSNISQQYEFSHFILLKFCASVHLYLCDGPQTAINNKRLHMCIPMVCGIGYGRKRNFTCLISNLKKPVHKEKFWLQKVLEYQDRNLFVQSLYESQTSFNDVQIISIDILNGWNENNLSGENAEVYFTEKIKKLHKKIDYNKLKMFEIEEKNQHAMSLYNKKDFDNAKVSFRLVENEQKEFLGEKHEETLKTKFRIAKCFYDKKQYNDAEKLLRELQKIQKQISKEENASSLNTKYWVANCLYRQKQFLEAEKITKEVENMQKEILGENNSDTLSSKNLIALCLYRKKQFDDSEKLFREIEKTRKVVLGVKHRDTINSKYWIARCLYDTHQFCDAEYIFKEVENFEKEIFGVEATNTLNTKYWIGLCLFNRREFNEAEKVLKELEFLEEKIFGKTDPYTINVKQLIIECVREKCQK